MTTAEWLGTSDCLFLELEPKKLRTIQIHKLGQTEDSYKGFQACWLLSPNKSGLICGIALLLLSKVIALLATFPWNGNGLGKTRQSDLPEYTPLLEDKPDTISACFFLIQLSSATSQKIPQHDLTKCVITTSTGVVDIIARQLFLGNIMNNWWFSD